MTIPREKRYLEDYIASKFPQGGYIKNCPLGPILPGAAEVYPFDKAVNVSRPFRPMADLFVYRTDPLLLVEAKIRYPGPAIGQLVRYKNLIPSTPELQPYLGREVEMRLVCPWATPQLEAEANLAGVRIELFMVAWIQEYVDTYHRYWTAEYREARAVKQKMRELFGVE